MASCDPRGRDCIEENSLKTFQCDPTCTGIYADVEWVGQYIEQEIQVENTDIKENFRNEKGEETKEKEDKQGDKADADKEVNNTKNPTRLQEEETDMGDLNLAGPNQVKWRYSDQEIEELESDKIFYLKKII